MEGTDTNPKEYYESNSALRETIDLLLSGHFSGGYTVLFFAPLVDFAHAESHKLNLYLLFVDRPRPRPRTLSGSGVCSIPRRTGVDKDVHPERGADGKIFR